MAEQNEAAEPQDAERVVAAIEKSFGERIIVRRNTFKGRELVDIRIHFDAADEGEPEWRPTKKGVAIPLEQVDEVIEALQQAKA